MSGFLRSCLKHFVFLFISPLNTFSQTSSDYVDGDLITFNTNGAWCWFQDERTIVDTVKQKLVVGSVSNTGAIEAIIYNLKEKKVENKSQIGKLSIDDHNAPAFLLRPDGKYLAMFADHYDRYYSHYNIYDGNNWIGERKFNWQKTENFDSEPIAYSNLLYISGQKQIYNFARANDQSPHFLFSDDYGDTWNFGGRISTDPSSSYNKGYYKYWGNGVDRIDFCNTEQHPRDTWTSIYHGYIQEGKTHDSFGKVVDEEIYDVKNVPTKKDFTTVFADNTEVNGIKMRRCWQHDICRYDDGTIAILFKARANNSETDHRNFYSRFDGKEWKTTYLGKAGSKLYSSEQDYTGLGALHPDDPSTIFISSPFNPGDDKSKEGKREIWKGITADYGATWKWIPVTANSSKDNFRPIVPKWNRDNTALLWMRGTYNSAQNFKTQIVGILYHQQLGSIEKIERKLNNKDKPFNINVSLLRNDKVVIYYSLNQKCFVNITIYSLSGKIMATPIKCEMPIGSYNITWIPKIISPSNYILTINAAGYSQSSILTIF